MMPHAFPSQDLFSHLVGSAARAVKMAEKEAPIVKRRFSAVGLSQIDYVRLVKVAALTHDIGKGADQYYQKPSIEIRESKQGFTFNLHELPSAVIAERVCKNLVGIKEEESTIVFLAVLQHMSVLRDWLGSDIMVNSPQRWSFRIFGQQICGFLRSELGVSIPLEVDRNEVSRRVRETQDKYLRDKSMYWPKLYSLVLAPVIVGDCIDAYNFRKNNVRGSRRQFTEELEVALNERD
ncbi:MAG: HD domain-containing protein [Candidatus Bathyarchaeia archaeon]